jgi:uncharacterized protein
MVIQQKDDGKTGMFFIEHDDEIVAEMVYSWRGKDRIIIEHTGVDDGLKGKGAGKQLVAKSVEFAREKGIKIVPLCPFAKSVIDKTKEFQDVL